MALSKVHTHVKAQQSPFIQPSLIQQQTQLPCHTEF